MKRDDRLKKHADKFGVDIKMMNDAEKREWRKHANMVSEAVHPNRATASTYCVLHAGGNGGGATSYGRVFVSAAA
jgi:hypothetical protein